MLATFVVTNVNDSGPGSLRQAIIDANAASSPVVPDRIEFDLSGSGPHTISITSEPLPRIDDPVVIDGFTQAGASPNSNPFNQPSNAVLQVQLAGQSAFRGIEIFGSGIGSTIQGLVIGGFSTGILIASSNNTIQGNQIGTDLSGPASAANGVGVWILDGENNVIGGSAASARNVISGNDADGVLLGFTFSVSFVSFNTVDGNYIGAAADGETALGNGGSGIRIAAGTDNLIGGSVGNLVSGNQEGGVLLGRTSPGSGEALRNVVASNLIGTNRLGDSAIANSLAGVILTNSASDNSIGLLGSGGSNTIAFNDGTGVLVTPTTMGMPTGNPIRGNSIFSNTSLGIDLSTNLFPSPGDGVTINDPSDNDSGPNDLQNYPVLRSAVSNGSTQVTGFLQSTPSSDFVLDFYENLVADPSGNGEGQIFLGSTTVTTDMSGAVDFDVSGLPGVSATSFITATATNAAGSTSEFSSAVEPFQLSSIVGYKFDDLNGDGDDEGGGDPRLGGITIQLEGDTDDDGINDVFQTTTTDTTDGSYAFGGLLPGQYVVREVLTGGRIQTTEGIRAADAITQLGFALDKSGSISDSEFSLIKTGVHDALTTTIPTDSTFEITVAFFGSDVTTAVEPTLITSQADLDRVADAVLNFQRFNTTSTDLTGAITTLTSLLGSSANFEPSNPQIINITTDGSPTDRITAAAAANAALSGVIDEISAEAVGADTFDIDYLAEEIAGVEPGPPGNGAGIVESSDLIAPGFVLPINGASEFGPAIQAKVDFVVTPTAIAIEVRPGTRYTVPVTQPGDELVPQLAIGNFQTISISGSKFNDLDANGMRDPGEPGLDNVTIFIDGNGNGVLDAGERTTVTASDGSYSFTGLGPGVYSLLEVPQPGLSQTTPNPAPIVAASGIDVAGVDFGNTTGLGSISGIKFNDINSNGVQDPGEGGLQNFVIFSDENQNLILDPGERSAVTGPDGRYTIANLDAGRYFIREVQRTGFVQTAPPSRISGTILATRHRRIRDLGCGRRFQRRRHHGSRIDKCLRRYSQYLVGKRRCHVPPIRYSASAIGH